MLPASFIVWLYLHPLILGLFSQLWLGHPQPLKLFGCTNSALLFAHSPCNEESNRRMVCLWMHCARAAFLHLCMGVNEFIASSVPSTGNLHGILSKSKVHNENGIFTKAQDWFCMKWYVMKWPNRNSFWKRKLLENIELVLAAVQ